MRPDNSEPIAESSYAGYGDFGGVCAISQLAIDNNHLFNLEGLTDQQISNVGADLSCGSFMKDTKTGDVWHIFSDSSDLLEGRFFDGMYSEVIPELGMSANDLVKSGRFERIYFKDYFDVKYPLKFSFDRNCKYEDHPASLDCPDQGYFYG